MKKSFYPTSPVEQFCDTDVLYGAVEVPIIEKDENGILKHVCMNGLAGTADDYSLENLDRSGIVPPVTGFSSPASLEDLDAASSVASVLNDKVSIVKKSK